MKRFWEQVTIEPVDAEWRVLLDTRPLHIPGGAELRLPHRTLADAVAAEWRAAGGGRGGETSFSELPLTRIAGTAQARIRPDPEPVALALARYAESDLLCYRAAAPPALQARQAAAWQPWLDWAAVRFAAPLRVTEGIMYVAQPAGSLAALAAAVAAQPAHGLAALGVAVPALGSLVLGLALAEGTLHPADAHALATLDETFQEELWGEDAEAVTRRRRIGEEVAVAGRLLAMLRA
jgi:chaperone required for assembly of F1-ATPase